MQQTNLKKYTNYSFKPGGNAIRRILWHFVNALFFKTGMFPISGLKVLLLKLFGARVGTNVIIKPCVNIKYPWNLAIGDSTWIGEQVWLDNLVNIIIGSNVCLSQGAALITGSHDYKICTFDLITGPIVLEDGVWVGAFAVVNQGITIASHAMLTAGSIATKNLEAYSIYQGNPALKIRQRIIS